jgi:hypothetical protein
MLLMAQDDLEESGNEDVTGSMDETDETADEDYEEDSSFVVTRGPAIPNGQINHESPSVPSETMQNGEIRSITPPHAP